MSESLPEQDLVNLHDKAMKEDKARAVGILPEYEASRTQSPEEMISQLARDAEREKWLLQQHQEAIDIDKDATEYQKQLKETPEKIKRLSQETYKDGVFNYLALHYDQAIGTKGGNRFQEAYDEEEKRQQAYLAEQELPGAEFDKLSYDDERRLKELKDAARSSNLGPNVTSSAAKIFLHVGQYTKQPEVGLTWESYIKAVQDYITTNAESEKKHLEKPDYKPNEIQQMWLQLNREAPLKHLEGFAQTAMDFGDVEHAIDALAAGGFLNKPEVLEEIRGKVMDLVRSVDWEDRERADKIIEKLKKAASGIQPPAQQETKQV